VEFDDARPRPTAAIVRVAPGDAPECTSPSGTTLDVEGVGTAPGGPGLELVWDLSNTVTVFAGARGTTATLRAPLLMPSDAPVTLRFQALSGGLSAFDSRTVRVVDTVPPTIADTTVDVGCVWGSSTADPQQTTCARIGGTVADACSTPSVVVVRIRQFTVGSAIPASETQGVNCITADPANLDERIANHEYEVTWHALDGWGNASPDQVARFRIFDSIPPVPGCVFPHRITMIYDHPAP